MLSTLVMGAVAGTANAETKPATTKGKIKFEQSDGTGGDGSTTDPGDKTEPGDGGTVKPIPEPDGGDNGGSSTEGALRLTFVPMLDFGTNKLSAKTTDYYVHYQKILKDGVEKEVNNYFEVEDLRGGTKGWSVSLSNDETFTATGADSFNATLAISDMSAQSNSGQAADKTPSMGAVGETYVSLKNGNTVKLASADGAKKQGYGNWTFRFGTVTDKEANGGRNKAIKLTVPAGSIIEADKDYATTLTWNIEDVM